MQNVPVNIANTLARLAENYVLVKVDCPEGHIDFTSNDYLGVVKNRMGEEPDAYQDLPHGATSVRLLTGTHPIHLAFEKWCATFYEGEAAMLFGSGFSANLGVIEAVAQRGDVILYDKLIHASLRDGVRLSLARNFSFEHNDFTDLRNKLMRLKPEKGGDVFVIVESLYSMDGDLTDMIALTNLCEEFGAYIIVDEAHSTGVYGEQGKGWCHEQGVHHRIFARIYTFGKGIGRKGAVVVTSEAVNRFLVNRCHTFIYSTAFSPSEVSRIWAALRATTQMDDARKRLFDLSEFANYWFSKIEGVHFEPNNSPLKPIFIGGSSVAVTNKLVQILKQEGIIARIVLSPVVPPGTERIRIALHSYNTEAEIMQVYHILTQPQIQQLLHSPTPLPFVETICETV